MKIDPSFSPEARPRVTGTTPAATGPGEAAAGASRASDRIDRSLPQGDVYFGWAKGAAWDAFFRRKDSGMATNAGPKTPAQMASAIEAALQTAADAKHVPIRFHTTPATDGYRVTGRDRNDSGVDVSVSRDDVVRIATTQCGVRSGVLGATERWHHETHDTGYLEQRAISWPRDAPWTAAYPQSSMTGKHDES